MRMLTIVSTLAVVLSHFNLGLAGQIWLGGYESLSVGVFDRDTSLLIDEIALGQYVEDVDFSADGNTAFVTPFTGNLIKVVDANTRRVTGDIDIGFVSEAQIERRPHSANLYIGPCDDNRPELLVIDGNTGTAIDLDSSAPGVQGIATPTSPWKMGFSPDGHFAYATSCEGVYPGEILKIDLEQNVFVKSIPFQGRAINSVAVSDDGTLAVVAGSGDDKAGIIDLTTDTEIGIHEFGSGVNDGVAIDKNRQRAYVLHYDYGTHSARVLGLDISDPTNPTLASTTTLDDPATPGGYIGQSLRRIDSLLYATLFDGPSGSEMVVLDISVEPPQVVTRQSFGDGAFSQVVLRPPSDVDRDGVPDIDDPCPADALDQCNVEGSTAGEVSADQGGTVETPDGSLVLDIDPGDLGADTTISATDTIVGNPEVDLTIGPDPGLGTAVRVYDLEPDGLQFDTPISLTITADVSELNADQRNNLDLYLLTDTDGDSVPDTFVSINAVCVVAEDPPGTFVASCTAENILHFSTYALVAPRDSDNDGVPDDFGGQVDLCRTQDATGFDVDDDGCIDSFSGLVDLVTKLVAEEVISQEIQNSLVAKISNAESSVEKDKICTAVNELDAFENQTDAQRGKKISDEAADRVVAYANSVGARLESELPDGDACN